MYHLRRLRLINRLTNFKLYPLIYIERKVTDSRSYDVIIDWDNRFSKYNLKTNKYFFDVFYTFYSPFFNNLVSVCYFPNHKVFQSKDLTAWFVRWIATPSHRNHSKYRVFIINSTPRSGMYWTTRPLLCGEAPLLTCWASLSPGTQLLRWYNMGFTVITVYV